MSDFDSDYEPNTKKRKADSDLDKDSPNKKQKLSESESDDTEDLEFDTLKILAELAEKKITQPTEATKIFNHISLPIIGNNFFDVEREINTIHQNFTNCTILKLKKFNGYKLGTECPIPEEYGMNGYFIDRFGINFTIGQFRSVKYRMILNKSNVKSQYIYPTNIFVYLDCVESAYQQKNTMRYVRITYLIKNINVKIIFVIPYITYIQHIAKFPEKISFIKDKDIINVLKEYAENFCCTSSKKNTHMCIYHRIHDILQKYTTSFLEHHDKIPTLEGKIKFFYVNFSQSSIQISPNMNLFFKTVFDNNIFKNKIMNIDTKKFLNIADRFERTREFFNYLEIFGSIGDIIKNLGSFKLVVIGTILHVCYNKNENKLKTLKSFFKMQENKTFYVVNFSDILIQINKLGIYPEV